MQTITSQAIAAQQKGRRRPIAAHDAGRSSSMTQTGQNRTILTMPPEAIAHGEIFNF
jgi:hypothetical protein